MQRIRQEYRRNPDGLLELVIQIPQRSMVASLSKLLSSGKIIRLRKQPELKKDAPISVWISVEDFPEIEFEAKVAHIKADYLGIVLISSSKHNHRRWTNLNAWANPKTEPTPYDNAPTITTPPSPSDAAPSIVTPPPPSDAAPSIVTPPPPSDAAPSIVTPPPTSDDAPSIITPPPPSDDAPSITTPPPPSDDAPLITTPPPPSDDAPSIITPPPTSDDAPSITTPPPPSDAVPTITTPPSPSDNAPLITTPPPPSDAAPSIVTPPPPSDDAPSIITPPPPSDDAPSIITPPPPSDDAPTATTHSDNKEDQPSENIPQTTRPADHEPITALPSYPEPTRPNPIQPDEISIYQQGIAFNVFLDVRRRCVLDTCISDFQRTGLIFLPLPPELATDKILLLTAFHPAVGETLLFTARKTMHNSLRSVAPFEEALASLKRMKDTLSLIEEHEFMPERLADSSPHTSTNDTATPPETSYKGTQPLEAPVQSTLPTEAPYENAQPLKAPVQSIHPPETPHGGAQPLEAPAQGTLPTDTENVTKAEIPIIALAKDLTQGEDTRTEVEPEDDNNKEQISEIPETTEPVELPADVVEPGPIKLHEVIGHRHDDVYTVRLNATRLGALDSCISDFERMSLIIVPLPEDLEPNNTVQFQITHPLCDETVSFAAHKAMRDGLKVDGSYKNTLNALRKLRRLLASLIANDLKQEKAPKIHSNPNQTLPPKNADVHKPKRKSKGRSKPAPKPRPKPRPITSNEVSFYVQNNAFRLTLNIHRLGALSACIEDFKRTGMIILPLPEGLTPRTIIIFQVAHPKIGEKLLFSARKKTRDSIKPVISYKEVLDTLTQLRTTILLKLKKNNRKRRFKVRNLEPHSEKRTEHAANKQSKQSQSVEKPSTAHTHTARPAPRHDDHTQAEDVDAAGYNDATAEQLFRVFELQEPIFTENFHGQYELAQLLFRAVETHTEGIVRISFVDNVYWLHLLSGSWLQDIHVTSDSNILHNLIELLLNSKKLTRQQYANIQRCATKLRISTELAVVRAGEMTWDQLRISHKARHRWLLKRLAEKNTHGNLAFAPLNDAFIRDNERTTYLKADISIAERFYPHIWNTIQDIPREELIVCNNRWLDLYPTRVTPPPMDLEQIPLTPKQLHFYNDFLGHGRKMRTLISNLSRSATIRTLLVLETVGFVRFVDSVENDHFEQESITFFKNHLESLYSKNDFQCLDSHWSSFTELIEEDYYRQKERFHIKNVSPRIRDHVKDDLREINVILDNAFHRLLDDDWRAQLRHELMDYHMMLGAIEIYSKQGDMAAWRREFDVARDCYMRILEINPSNDAIRRKLMALLSLASHEDQALPE